MAVVDAAPTGQCEDARVLSSVVDGLCDPSGKQFDSADFFFHREFGAESFVERQSLYQAPANEASRWVRSSMLSCRSNVDLYHCTLVVQNPKK